MCVRVDIVSPTSFHDYYEELEDGVNNKTLCHAPVMMSPKSSVQEEQHRTVKFGEMDLNNL